MRKIFSSPRLENVEAVARLLQAEGIEVRIENGRALHRAIRGNFSYLDAGKSKTPEPEVWVIRADDQPRARALMREAGLLQDTTRTEGQLFAPRPHAPAQGNKRISRLRYGLLALLLVAVAVSFMRRPSQTPDVPAPAPAALTVLDEAIIFDEARYVIPTPPLLAVMLARRALAAQAADALCLAIDGDDPPGSALAALAADGITAHPASTCPPETALNLDVHRYTTDGSGTGTVLIGRADADTSELTVRRNGEHWAVLADDHPS